MIRFLHTGDWQLGITRHFFSEGVQERFAQSRFDAIRELGRIAKEEDCRFMVVCGDVFESNLVDRKTVSRAIEALKDVPVPVYLLPGNHDPLNAASVYHSTTFLERKTAHVHVIEDTTPIRVDDGIEIVGIPWTSKHPLQDIVALTTGTLEPIAGALRVCVAHGMVDSISPNPDDPAAISLHAAEEAISKDKIHYLALGDRHSLTEAGDSGRIWYAGTPEATDYNEVKPGFALVASIDEEGVTMKEVNIGRWKFIEREHVDLNTKEDIEALRCWFENLEDKERTVVKLRLVGALSLSLHGELEELLSQVQEILGAVETRMNNLTVIPEDADFMDFGFSGFAGCTVARLRSNIEKSGADSITSRDALALLVRLAGKKTMRILRLRLADYRGIDESEVRFAPKGLTIVEGPNEAGKTSLSEAIGLLFDYLDSSRHSAVKAIQPVTRDVGPEIELKAESGPYVFTYFKRFHKKPETTLAITSPKQENHTGREAHERAEEILRETIDIDLWKALCIQQGEAVRQADLSKQTSLSAALDFAAGGYRADPREESLFDKVREEYGRYFTERGSEKKDLQEARKVREETEAEVASLEKQIQDLEKDIVRAAELGRELERLKKQEEDLRGDVFEYTKSLDEIKGLETALETARLKLESAQKSEQAAKRDREVRRDLIDEVSKVRKARTKLDESCASSTASVKKAEDDLEKAQSFATKAEAGRKEAESLLKLRHADSAYFNNKLHLEQLRERKDRIDRSRQEAVLAGELLASSRVDEDVLKSIQKAERSLITAQAKLETGAPNVLLRGLADLAFRIDGEQTTISKDEEINLSVSDRVRVTIPGSLQVEVTAGSGSSDLSKKVEEAKQKLDAACNDAGVSNADEARQSYDARREAQQSIARQKEIEKENLRDLTYEQLDGKVIGLGRSVPAYPAARIPEPGLPENLEDAKKELRSAEAGLEKANKAWEEARTELDAARKVRDELRERHQKVKVELDLKTEELNRAEDELMRSRKITSDDDLESEHSKYSKLVHTEEEKVKSAEADLHDKEPDRVKALAETAKGSLETAGKKREAAQNESTEVRTRLKVFGEEGLHEKLHAARSHLDHIMQENAAMIRRAQAAGLLYGTMKEERDKARRAYVAPLKEKIERLGRLVFNDSFEVEVTEDLSVASRAMDGSSVPFESLSGGTKEQISLISRLACAMTVSKDGGASLILDDALGYTDPARLKRMGAVLARAGKECQIIILTCVPDRYNNVGEATTVRLG